MGSTIFALIFFYIAENPHLYGLGFFSIYDTVKCINLKKVSQLTFQARMELLMRNFCFFKSKCNVLMRGDGVQLIVAGPSVKLIHGNGNHKHNGHRVKQYKLGAEVLSKAKVLNNTDAIENPDNDEAGDAIGYNEDLTYAFYRSAPPEHRHETHEDGDIEYQSFLCMNPGELMESMRLFATMCVNKRPAPDESWGV
jgi:hypothetical protein